MEEQNVFGKPTGVVLLVLFLIIAAIGDFSNGGWMLLGSLPITPVYAIFGIIYPILLLVGGAISVFLCYGFWTLKTWARVGFQLGFPIQVFVNLLLDPAYSATYFLLALSLLIALYLQLPTTRQHFT